MVEADKEDGLQAFKAVLDAALLDLRARVLQARIGNNISSLSDLSALSPLQAITRQTSSSIDASEDTASIVGGPLSGAIGPQSCPSLQPTPPQRDLHGTYDTGYLSSNVSPTPTLTPSPLMSPSTTRGYNSGRTVPSVKELRDSDCVSASSMSPRGDLVLSTTHTRLHPYPGRSRMDDQSPLVSPGRQQQQMQALPSRQTSTGADIPSMLGLGGGRRLRSSHSGGSLGSRVTGAANAEAALTGEDSLADSNFPLSALESIGGGLIGAQFTLSKIWSEHRRASERLAEFNSPMEFSLAMVPTRTAPTDQPWWIIHPDSLGRIMFVLLGAIIIVYDMMVVPLLYSGLVPASISSIPVVEWSTFLFWVVDLVSNFMTGYHQELDVQFNPRKIAKHYLKGWFAPDVTIILIDLLFLVQHQGDNEEDDEAVSSSSIIGVSRMVRLLRIARALRLVRVARLIQLSTDWLQYMTIVNTDFSIVVARVVRLVWFILVLNHYLACIWYAIGRWSGEAQASWLEEVIKDDKLSYYCAAFHWSLTQFTPATQNLAPRNEWERIYACIVVLMALLTFSTFVGKMTSAMTQLLSLNTKRDNEQMLLRRFFSENKLTDMLRVQIWQCWKHQSYGHRRLGIAREEVPYLAEMPKRLQMRMDMELRTPHLCFLKIFEVTERESKGVLPFICHFAMREHAGIHLQEIFMPRSNAYEAFCLTSGEMRYESKYVSGGAVTVVPQSWVCEPVFWGDWVHRGWLTAEGSCFWISLNGEAFRAQVTACIGSPFGIALKKYARGFERLARDRENELFDVVISEEDQWKRTNLAMQSAPDQQQVAPTWNTMPKFFRRGTSTLFGPA